MRYLSNVTIPSHTGVPAIDGDCCRTLTKFWQRPSKSLSTSGRDVRSFCT